MTKFKENDVVYWYDFGNNKLCRGTFVEYMRFPIAGNYYAKIKKRKNNILKEVSLLNKNKMVLLHNLHADAKEDYNNAKRRMNWATKKLETIEKLLQKETEQ